MAAALTPSRLAMWRAVIALAHADGVVMPSESEFAATYMDRTGASDEQRETLRQDLMHPADPGEAFARIADPADKADFFQFARALLWHGGDTAAQEEAIVARLQSAHIAALRPEELTATLRQLHDAQIAARMKADAQEGDWAHRHVGLGAILSRVYW